MEGVDSKGVYDPLAHLHFWFDFLFLLIYNKIYIQEDKVIKLLLKHMIILPIGLVWGVSSVFIFGLLFMTGIPLGKDNPASNFLEFVISLVVLLPITIYDIWSRLLGIKSQPYEDEFLLYSLAISGVIAAYLFYGIFKIIKFFVKKLKQ